MSVVTTSISGFSQPTSYQTSADKSSIDYDAFLQLFIAQLKSQDPLNPRDPADSLAQLASFSNVEQSLKLNDKIDQLLVAANLTMSSTVIGWNISNLEEDISGTVVSIETRPDGLTAILESGEELSLSQGYRISRHE
jgi:flagellar basal-body rod modification protein FlgD